MSLSRIGFVLAVLLLASTAAHADGLTFLGPTANGEFGPYTMSLNGGAPVQMICFSDQNWISAGESWTVAAFTINQASLANQVIQGPNKTLSLAQYNELGYLADQLFANPGNATLQNDIWGVIDGTFKATAPSGYQTSDIFYIPISGPNSQGSTGLPKVDGTPPQPFIALPVPEPSTLVLLGAGMLALIGLSLKKLVA